jgi:hypothetical protein
MAARWSRPALPLLPLLLLVAVAVAPLLPFVCARPFDPSAPPPNPNPPSPAVVAERNARRFPGEWLPPGPYRQPHRVQLAVALRGCGSAS